MSCFALLFLSQPSLGKIPSQSEQELLNAQLDRIHTLFRRQLAVPLLGEWNSVVNGLHCAHTFCFGP